MRREVIADIAGCIAVGILAFVVLWILMAIGN